MAIQLIKVKRKQDEKHNREEQRVESVLTGKQVSTKPQVFNIQYKAPAWGLVLLAHMRSVSTDTLIPTTTE